MLYKCQQDSFKLKAGTYSLCKILVVIFLNYKSIDDCPVQDTLDTTLIWFESNFQCLVTSYFARFYIQNTAWKPLLTSTNFWPCCSDIEDEKCTPGHRGITVGCGYWCHEAHFSPHPVEMKVLSTTPQSVGGFWFLSVGFGGFRRSYRWQFQMIFTNL